jgi:hypothetical protein
MRIVSKVALVLAFGVYAWWGVDLIGQGGWAMWCVLVGCPLVLTLTWLTAREQKRIDARRAALGRRLEPLGGYPPFVDMADRELNELFDAVRNAAGFETLPAKWQSAIREAEQNRPPDWGALTGKRGAPGGSVGEPLPDPTGPHGLAPPSRPDASTPDRAPVLPVEPFFGEVSEEASRYWSRRRPRLVHAGRDVFVAVGGAAGICLAAVLAETYVLALAIAAGTLILVAVVAVWLSKRYEIPLELPPRPPPDPRNAPDQASFRVGVPLLLSLFVLPLLLYSVIIPVLVLVGPDPPIGAEDAPMWLASAGIVLALAVAASVRMFRIRMDIDAGGLSVINFWKTRVIPWESVRAIRTGVPRWASPVFSALAVAMAAAGKQDPGDAPPGLRISFSDSEHGVPDAIFVSATLGFDPQRHPRHQEALATLVKQVHAHPQTLRGSRDGIEGNRLDSVPASRLP